MKRFDAGIEMPSSGEHAEDALEPADFIKVEKNLTSLGFFTPTSNKVRKAKAKKVSFTRVTDGRRERVSVTIAPTVLDEAPILPSTAHQDKYLAFQKIILDRRVDGEQITNPVAFTSAELVRELGREKDGRLYKEISEWLDIMTATTIFSEGAVYFAGRKTYGRDRFHVFDRSVSFGHEMPDGSVADKNYVWLSEWQLENLNNNHLLPIDFESYKRLKNHIAKSLVPILQIWLYASKDEGAFEKRYDELCQYLNIKQYQHLSKIKEKLSPGLDELVACGYLASWKVDTTSDDKGYKVTLRHGKKFYRDSLKRLEQRATATDRARGKTSEQLLLHEANDRKPSPSRRSQTATANAATEGHEALIRDLMEHGMHRKTASQLVNASPDEVRRQLDYLPYRTVKKNKGGLLRDAILGNWSPPDEYGEAQKRSREQSDNHERLKRKRDEEAKSAARQKTEEKLKRDYYDHLNQLLGRMERDLPRVYDAFIKDSAEKRSLIEQDSTHKGAAKKIYLRLFDDNESHLERARDFFNEPSFDEWKQHHRSDTSIR